MECAAAPAGKRCRAQLLSCSTISTTSFATTVVTSITYNATNNIPNSEPSPPIPAYTTTATAHMLASTINTLHEPSPQATCSAVVSALALSNSPPANTRLADPKPSDRSELDINPNLRRCGR